MAKEKDGHQQPGLVRSSARTARRKENGVRAACEFCALIADVSYLLSRRVAPATAVDWMSGGRLTGSRSAAGRSGRLEVA